MNKLKKCSRCGELKPLNKFYKSLGKKDGHRYECADCFRKNNHKRWVEVKGTPKSKKWIRDNNARRRHSLVDKIKNRVRYITKVAIRRGEIEKKDYCSICGNTEKVQVHHPDYSKPLFVIFLCERCHKKTHWKVK